MSSFSVICPKCGNIVRRSLGFDLFNTQYCSCCGLAYKDFASYVRGISTVGTGDYYYDA